MEPRNRQRDHVIDVAFELFLERGYEQVTIEEIADAAGISPRTFYRYFDAKDGVLAEVGRAAMDQVVIRLEPTDEPPPVELLARTLAEVFVGSLDFPRVELYVRLLRERPELREKVGRWREQWAARLAQRLAEADGRDRPSFAEQVVTRVTMALVAVAFDDWILNDPSRASVAAAVEAALSVLRATPQGPST